jgi:hypothetical protein
MNLLAQIADRSWQEILLGYGPLGVGAFLSVMAAVWVSREFWKVYKPYLEAKLKAENERRHAEAAKETRQAEYVARITESHGEDMEVKRRQVALLEKMDARQTHHAEACDATHKLVTELHGKIVHGSPQPQ